MRYFKMISYDTVATIDSLQRVVPVCVLRVDDALPEEGLVCHDEGVLRHTIIEFQVVGEHGVVPNSACQIFPFAVLMVGDTLEHERVAGGDESVTTDDRRTNMIYIKMEVYDIFATIDRQQRVGPDGVLRVDDALPEEGLGRHDEGVRRHASMEVKVVGDDAVAFVAPYRIVPHAVLTVGDTLEYERVAGGDVYILLDNGRSKMFYFKLIPDDAVAAEDRLQRVVPSGALRVGDALPCEALVRHEGGVYRHAAVEVQVVGEQGVAPVSTCQVFPFAVLMVGDTLEYE